MVYWLIKCFPRLFGIPLLGGNVTLERENWKLPSSIIKRNEEDITLLSNKLKSKEDS